MVKLKDPMYTSIFNIDTQNLKFKCLFENSLKSITAISNDILI